jgi:ATP-binding cassette subfamily B protein
MRDAPLLAAAGPGEEHPHVSAATMRKRMSLLIGDRRWLIVALAFASILAGFSEAATLALVAQVAYALVTGAKQVHQHIGPFHIHAPIGTVIEIAFGLTLIRLALQFPISYLPARIASDVQLRLRTSLFRAFSRASWELQSRDREGQLQETMTSQVNQATGATMQMTSLISASLTFIVLLSSAFALNVVAAVAVFAISIAGFLVLRPLRRLAGRFARELSQAQVRLAGAIAESVRLAEETHVFGVGGAQRRRLDGFARKSSRLFYRTSLLARLVPNIYQSLIYVLMVAGLAAVYAAGRSHAGSLAAVVLVLVRASSNGQAVQTAYQGLTQSMPFIERVQEAERRYLENAPPEGEVHLPRVSMLAFEDVGYAYRAGTPVLAGVTFEVNGGEAIGVVGPSGAGKSTLVQLLLRLREPSEGLYLINGEPVGRFLRDDWHRRVAYVPQEPRLLHASVADNIRYFRDLDDDAVERAGRLARIHEDIMSWSHGYETIVGPRADAVSGGQQQRICLARALAAGPEVLVLDEPTSALDPHSEALISESLVALKHELTVFIVAHRMSTLDMCDRVMVIVDGRLVAFDTRALLEEQSGYYRTASLLAAGGSAQEPA